MNFVKLSLSKAVTTMLVSGTFFLLQSCLNFSGLYSKFVVVEMSICEADSLHESDSHIFAKPLSGVRKTELMK